MAEGIKIELTEKAQALLNAMKQMPSWAMDAVCLGMDRANALAVSSIQRMHLTGKGPFPPEEHKLGFVTHRLKSAAWASPAVASGTMVTSAIGDNVKYAEIHEFGGTVHHEARRGTVRLATDTHGTLLRQQGRANLAVFANMKKLSKLKTGNKRFKEMAYQAEAYDIQMPERAPFRTGIRETLEEYGKQVSREFISACRARL